MLREAPLAALKEGRKIADHQQKGFHFFITELVKWGWRRWSRYSNIPLATLSPYTTYSLRIEYIGFGVCGGLKTHVQRLFCVQASLGVCIFLSSVH